MPELLTDEEIEAITRAAYTGGKGDPERDVRRLLMHIEVLDKGHRFFLAYRDHTEASEHDLYLRQKSEHRRDAYQIACRVHDNAEKTRRNRELGL